MVDLDDELLAAPHDPGLMRRVTGCEPSGNEHVRIDDGTGIRLVQRLTISEHEGGVALLAWPAELKGQAVFLYSEGRAERVLRAATAGGWEVVARPHLSYFQAPPRQRFYMTPRLSARNYARQWAAGDIDRVGAHPLEGIEALWRWLLERRYASESDRPEFDAFRERLAKSRRPAHLRPGLRLKREWPAAEVRELRRKGALEETLRDAFDRLLTAAGDPRLPLGSR